MHKQRKRSKNTKYRKTREHSPNSVSIFAINKDLSYSMNNITLANTHQFKGCNCEVSKVIQLVIKHSCDVIHMETMTVWWRMGKCSSCYRPTALLWPKERKITNSRAITEKFPKQYCWLSYMNKKLLPYTLWLSLVTTE